MQGQFDRYLKTLGSVLDGVVATDGAGNPLPMGFAVASTASAARRVHDVGGKAMFIGNGGSAAISSHMAIDSSKNGRVHQIGFHARAGDLLFAISSSGRSADIVKAVAAARDIGCQIVTLSGFTPDNPLRLLGDINLFVPSDAYGFVEISHLVLCHAVVDYLASSRLAPSHLTEAEPATEGAY
jgi:D-sedoheptulose 7-phosphate isomerase